MPGRFPLVAVAITNDAFCEGGFCEDSGPPLGGLVVPPNGPAWGQTLEVVTLYTGQTVQWLRNDIPIAGATSPTYTLGDDDMGKNISATITGSGGATTPTGSGGATTTTTDSINGGTFQLYPEDYPDVTVVQFFITYTTSNFNVNPCLEQFWITNAGGISELSRFPIDNHVGRITLSDPVGIGILCNHALGVCRYASRIVRFRDGINLNNDLLQSNCGETLNSKHKLWVKPVL